MDLNTIQSDGRWGDVAAFINANFEKIRLELMKLRHASILTFCKGYFSTESRFLKKYPTGKTGEYAFVGIPWPGTVYEWADTEWVNTGIAPQLGEAVFIEMLKRHIDNETIYWDATDEVIKSAGGGDRPEETFSITVGVNPANVGQCAVEAEGAMSVISDATGASWTVRAGKGSTVTVIIVPETGYQVQQLNIDTVSQGAVSEYTFESLEADHTMYVWMEAEVEEAPMDFLVRSDLPGTFYSSTHVALNAIKADYPDGLTQDVTLTCVKQAKERRIANDPDKNRNEQIFLSVLKDWNMGALHTLTIDGNGFLTYDCASLGGLKFTNVDNIILSDIAFINYCNFIDGSTPDEVAAVMLIGSKDSYCRNLYIAGCTFDGLSTTNKTTGSTFILSTKYTENVYVNGNLFCNNAGMAFNMTDARLVTFSRNEVSGVFRSGAVAHAGLFNVTNGYRLILEDNHFDGSSFRESLMYFSNIEVVSLKRNYIHDGARIIEMSSNTAIKKLELESNLIVNMLQSSIFGWIHECIYSTSDILELRFLNNTLWMGGNDWMQFILRVNAIDVRTASIHNNIIVDPDPSLSSGKINLFNFKTLGSLSMGGNLLKVSIKDPEKGNTYGEITAVANPDGNSDSITVTGSNSRSLGYLRNAGLDSNSTLVVKSDKLLDIENGGATYALTADYDGNYPANNDYVPAMDKDYKQKSAAANSRGCYNLHGTAIDENGDTTTGYTGEDLTVAASFDSSAQYTAIADSSLLLVHNTLNRSRFVRFRIEGTQHRSLALGRYALVHMHPEVDAYGEYQAEELYTVNID